MPVPKTRQTAENDPPLVRQWTLLRTLSARRLGVTVQEVAAEMGVHEKTIRRDLALLASVGFPLDESRGEHGQKRWRLGAPSGHELTFAFDEALALFLGRRFLDPLAGTLLWEAAQRAFKKIRASLGDTALNYLEQMMGNLIITTRGAGDYSRHSAIIDDLLRAIEERKATHIGYRSQRATEPVTYEIHPYGIVYHRGSLYLVAWSRDHNELRHFKIDRVSEVEVSQFPFPMPVDFDLQSHLAKSFGVFHGDGQVQVKVRFSAEVARYVTESNWHASQKLSPQRDGSLLAEFQLSSTEEIKRWILSFGRQAEVLEPAGLRMEICSEADNIAHMYNDVRSTGARNHKQASGRTRAKHPDSTK